MQPTRQLRKHQTTNNLSFAIFESETNEKQTSLTDYSAVEFTPNLFNTNNGPQILSQ